MSKSASRKNQLRRTSIKDRENSRLRKSNLGLMYDGLEPRLTLTTFMVTGLGDSAGTGTDGLISLREAIIAANTNAPFGDAPAGGASGDSIQFDALAANSTIKLTAGQLRITDDVLIQAGSSNITVDGNAVSRIFEVATSERVVFSNMNFIRGLADRGAAINSSAGGITLVSGSTFDANAATGLGGGAIYHEFGSLYVTNSTFSNNRATGAAGSGGAILSASGTAVITNGSMVSNIANRAGGAVEVVNGNFYMTNVAVGAVGKGNIAGPTGSANPGNGGGLHVTGVATTLISGGSFIENTAAQEGGALWNQVGSQMFIRNGVTITDNVAAGNAADDGGGGIFNNGGNVYITGATINSNEATGASGSGGGIFSTNGKVLITNSTIDANAAGRAGGGIEIIDGFSQLLNTIVSNNDAGISFPAAPGNGGGLHVTGTASVVIDGGQFVTNRAAREGGGIWNQTAATMIIRNGAVVSNNTALGAAADDGGGGIFNNGGSVYVTNAVISGNRATGAAGSGGGIFSTAGNILFGTTTISNNSAAGTGGGVEIINGFIRFLSSAVNTNTAGVAFTANPGNGGGLHVAGTATTIISGGQFTGNTAANQGGGIWNENGSSLFIQNSASIRNNKTNATNSPGGGVYNKGFLKSLDSFFQNNNAGALGGGIFSDATAVTRISNTNFNGNTASTRGGAFYNIGYAFVENSNFIANIVSVSGGAIFTGPLATTILSANSFSGNLPNNTN